MSLCVSNHKSHPVRGAWIEIKNEAILDEIKPSHPVRGAWIEILDECLALRRYIKSHPVRGAWIEMTKSPFIISLVNSRTPSGVRGLK